MVTLNKFDQQEANIIRELQVHHDKKMDALKKDIEKKIDDLLNRIDK